MWKKFKKWLRILRHGNRLEYKAKQIELKGCNYLIRQVEEEDIKDLLTIEREVYFGEVPWNYTAFRYELGSLVPNLYLLVSTIDLPKKVVAFVGCRMANQNAHITNIAVLPSFQGKGIGSWLVDEIKKVALKEDCVTVTLEVRMSNKKAQSLYRKKGFISRTIKKGYYTNPSEDGLDMVCHLEEN